MALVPCVYTFPLMHEFINAAPSLAGRIVRGLFLPMIVLPVQVFAITAPLGYIVWRLSGVRLVAPPDR